MPVVSPLYPVNLVLEGRRVLLVGGGRVAASKLDELVRCGARVHVVAPEIDGSILERDDCTWELRPYRPDEVAGYRLVITATDVGEVNRAVAEDAERHEIWVNSADDPANCTFTLPARVRQGSLLVTVATGGASPAMATWLRRRFSEELGPEYGTLVELLADARAELQASGRSTESVDWQFALDSGMLELVREGRLAEAKERLQACLSSSSD